MVRHGHDPLFKVCGTQMIKKRQNTYPRPHSWTGHSSFRLQKNVVYGSDLSVSAYKEQAGRMYTACERITDATRWRVQRQKRQAAPQLDKHVAAKCCKSSADMVVQAIATTADGTPIQQRVSMIPFALVVIM